MNRGMGIGMNMGYGSMRVGGGRREVLLGGGRGKLGGGICSLGMPCG